MIRVAWLTYCALLSVAGARVYERCELARELHALGVQPDHISTWVCIAYHESRFDTAAKNHYSGDHGIFQISELYWCGPGKACGLPCSALRDEDISDDLECALRVHEEHTRLQGNGFLAWVVYPQHCKQNTKKYLVDCDTSFKSSVPIAKSRAFHYANSYSQPNVTSDRQNIDNLLPPYLSIGSIVRQNYGKVIDGHKGRVDWYNYKIDNIDELTLPVFNQPSQHISVPPTSAPRSTTAATTTTYIPPVKPWRTIETNQFRKKKLFTDTSTQKTKNEYSTELERYTQSTKTSTAIQLPRATVRPLIIATTLRPTTTTTVTTTTYRPPTSTTTYRTPTFTSTYRTPTSTTARRSPISTTTYRTPSFTTTYRPPISTTTSRTTTSTTTRRSPISTTTYRTPSFTTTYRTPTSTTTYRPPISTTTYKPSTSRTLPTRQWYSTTTQKPTSVAPRIATTIYKSTTIAPKSSTTKTTTTKGPKTAGSTWTWSSTTSRTPTVVTERAVTRKPKTDFSWYTFTSRIATTTPVTTKLQTAAQTRSTQPSAYSTKIQNNSHTKTTRTVTSTTKKPPTTTQKPRSTQSIFDLYLNPTKAPKFTSFTYNWGQSKLKIFAGGTTTPAPVQATRERGENSNGAAKNFVKRQTLRESHNT